jgi:hypothetical protein
LETAATRVARQFGHVFHADVLWLESICDLSATLAEVLPVHV